MPKVNVYLPEELAAAVREHHVPVSSVCQRALEQAVQAVSAVRETSQTGPAGGVGPFSRFTPRARKAVEIAREQALTRGHASVDTEHLLAGVLDEGGNLAVTVLTAIDVEPADVRTEIEAVLVAEPRGDERDAPHFTARSKAVLDCSAREAVALGHNYVGCEHLLLGLIADDEGVAGRVLRGMGVELRTTRRAVVHALLGFVQARTTATTAPAPGTAIEETLRDIVARLDAIERRLDS